MIDTARRDASRAMRNYLPASTCK